MAHNVSGLCARLEFEKQKIMITKERLVDLICSHSEGATENVADGVMYNILADAILLELQPNGAKPDVSGALPLDEFIGDVEHMMKLYGNSRYTQAEEWRDKLAERLDDIMRLGGNDR